MNGVKKSERKPLLDKHSRFQELTQQATRQLESLGKQIDILEKYKEELSHKEREKLMKNRMKELAVQVNKMINQTADVFRELKLLKFTKPNDKESRKKTLKRLRGYFSRQHDRFTQAISIIQTKEKIYIEQRVSFLSNSSSSSVSAASIIKQQQIQSFGDPEIEASMQDIDFFQAILEEREKQLHQIRGIAYEIKIMAEDQAKALVENQQDLENAVNNMSIVEKNVNEGNEELDKVEEKAKKKKFDSKWKRNIAVCLLVFILCGIVLIVTLTTGTIKFS